MKKKYYVFYQGFNEFDGLACQAESREQAFERIKEALTDEFGNTLLCELSDIYEFDCQEAFEASRLYTEICGQ